MQKHDSVRFAVFGIAKSAVELKGRVAQNAFLTPIDTLL